MHSFSSYALRCWLEGWSEDNYANLTRASSAILNFSTQSGLSFSVSQSPTPTFANSATLTAYDTPYLPSVLSGNVSYLAARPSLKVSSSSNVNLKRFVDHFGVPAPSHHLSTTTQTYLLFGCLHIPAPQLDALYARRLTDTTLALVTLKSVLPAEPRQSSSSLDTPILLSPYARATTTYLALQHRKDRWAADYSYSLEDGLFGARWLHTFKRKEQSVDHVPLDTISDDLSDSQHGLTGGAGLRGNFSAGAEVYFSAITKSAGCLRFATTPDRPSLSNNSPIPSQPPTVLTATCNPIMGHVSASIASQISRNVALASRYDFNFYSFVADLSVGAEWWQRRRSVGRQQALSNRGDALPAFWNAAAKRDGEPVSVVKIRMSSEADISLAYEAKLGRCLVALGLQGRIDSRPLKSFGLSVQYFGS